MVVVVGVEAETERSNAAVAAASHRVARHRVDVPVAPMLFAAVVAAHIVGDPATSATSSRTTEAVSVGVERD